ncbi:NAD(P)-dependent oxidoreductase [Exiguobacterium sp. RIT594]|uniref:NAD-dependent epimerase/dehydratase family protein n=1 Tax=Exiguobacterium sp. RIT594 TaxID=2282449 RepID=UPI000DF8260E|nr:NAD-dependent epimerase/dehydratase family protein [Exiguobacterium sp. RIT594]RDB34170.1 NAD-dependent epimerase/dehydratase family protein [Exiguobacterium sp. RIT594]
MELSGKRILVTGVTGTLGLRIAKRLLSEALEVRGLIRQAERFNEFESLGITPVFGDLTNQTSLEKAMDQIDWVVHCAAYLGDDENLARQSNVEGVIHLATVALNTGARVLHISTTSVYGEPADGHLTESSPLAVEHPAPYIQTKIRSEQILNDYAARGLDVRILRPGAICAEQDSHWGDRQVRRMQEADFRMRLIEASGKPYQVPDRALERPTYATDKIKTLGYKPVRSFDETMDALLALFSLPATRE